MDACIMNFSGILCVAHACATMNGCGCGIRNDWNFSINVHAKSEGTLPVPSEVGDR